jgi:hypothetical protein
MTDSLALNYKALISCLVKLIQDFWSPPFYFLRLQCNSHQLISVADFGQRVHHVKCLISSCLYNLFIFKLQFPLWVRACEPAYKTPLLCNLQLTGQYLYRTCLRLCALRQPSHLSNDELAKQLCLIYLSKWDNSVHLAHEVSLFCWQKYDNTGLVSLHQPVI